MIASRDSEFVIELSFDSNIFATFVQSNFRPVFSEFASVSTGVRA